MALSDIKKYLPDLSGIDYNTWDFKNHSSVTAWANSSRTFPPNYNYYKSLRSHYKIFCNWLSSNKYPSGTLYVSTMQKSGQKVSGFLTHSTGSESHDKGYAIDISGSKPEILLFYYYLKNIARPEYNLSIGGEGSDCHIHTDIRDGIWRGRRSVEFTKSNGKYDTRVYTDADYKMLYEKYGWGLSEERMLKYMSHDTTASDLAKEASSFLPSFLWILFPLVLIILIFVRRK